ncbi:MAG: hypothetical protein JXQ87_14445 [Bacteroidia bacterium]
MKLLQVQIILAFILMVSCYKDTKTCRCAREERFDGENDCREVDRYYYPNTILTVRTQYFEGTERFAPQYDLTNENEIFINLIDHEREIPTMRVKVNLNTNEHRFIEFLDASPRFYGLYSFKAHKIFLGNQFCSFNRTDSCVFNPSIGLGGASWSPDGMKVIGSIREIFDDKLKTRYLNTCNECQIASISYPDLSVQFYDFFKGQHVEELAWSPNGDLAVVADDRVYLFNLSTGEKEIWLDTDAKIGILDIDASSLYLEWHPSNDELFVSSASKGIFKLKKGRNNQYRVKKSCVSRQYGKFSISPLGDKIISQRLDIKAERDGTYISENTKLVIMDIDGCNEKVLFEDWDGTVIGRP